MQTKHFSKLQLTVFSNAVFFGGLAFVSMIDAMGPFVTFLLEPWELKIATVQIKRM